MCHRGVRGGEATGREGGHGVVDGFECRHATEPIGDAAQQTQHQIDDDYVLGHVGRPRTVFLGLIGGFGLEQLHAADVEGGQHGNGQHDEADSPQPLQQGAPQQDAGRHVVEAGQHGRSRGGDPGHGLEIGVGEADLVDEDEGQGTEDTGDDPDRAGEHEHVAHPETELYLVADMQTDEGGDMSQDHRRQKLSQPWRASEERQQGGHPHEQGQFGERQPEGEEDRFEVNHVRGRTDWVGRDVRLPGCASCRPGTSPHDHPAG